MVKFTPKLGTPALIRIDLVAFTFTNLVGLLICLLVKFSKVQFLHLIVLVSVCSNNCSSRYALIVFFFYFYLLAGLADELQYWAKLWFWGLDYQFISLVTLFWNDI